MCQCGRTYLTLKGEQQDKSFRLVVADRINTGGSFLYNKVDRLIISGIALLSIFFCLTGCADKKNSMSLKKPIQKTGDSLTDSTYRSVQELNIKSDLLGITLLDSALSDMVSPGPNTIGTGPDYFNCFLYDGENRITQIGLLSENANVFGIAVGNSISQVKDILNNEGFEQLGDDDVKALINKNENAVSYQTAHLTLIFFIPESESTTGDAAITKILIDVDNPLEEKPIF